MKEDELSTLVERVREALVRAAVTAWQEAGVAGLCGEGQFEAAVGRMHVEDLTKIIAPNVDSHKGIDD